MTEKWWIAHDRHAIVRNQRAVDAEIEHELAFAQEATTWWRSDRDGCQ